MRAVPEGRPEREEARRCATGVGRTGADTALCPFRLETGRKHQIRVQLAHSGHPLRRDMRYGHGVRGQHIALLGRGAPSDPPHPERTHDLLRRAPRGNRRCSGLMDTGIDSVSGTYQAEGANAVSNPIFL